jgi:CBS domain-containing protein
MTITFCVTQVQELMTSHPEMISPSATLQQAAKRMKAVKCGALPVGTENKLKGIITDRDIVIRALAEGKSPAKELVGDYMSTPVFACNEMDTLEDAAEKMQEHKVSRLVVRNHEGRVTGILSFGSILKNDANPKEVASIVKHACGPIAI